MEPLTNYLAELCVPKETSLLFMPQGGLSLLPLHAAGYELDEKWHYFIDDYAVTYVPSISLLTANEKRLPIHAEMQTPTLLSVMQPEMKGKNGAVSRLLNAELEATAVASCFTHTTPLHNKQATLQATITQMPAHDYLHFNCHGTYDWNSVMKSGLLLANDEMLTLHDVLELILHNVRLITLSACETGIPEVNQSPDEYIGLPGGFLQTGIPGIVSTLWTVSESSTAIFMAYFYEKHIKAQLPPAVALRKTQVWLRNSTPQEIQAYFQQRIENGEYDLFPLFAEASKRPLQHPYFWAAFTFTGN